MLMLGDDDDDGEVMVDGMVDGWRRRNAYRTSNMEIDDGAKIFVQLWRIWRRFFAKNLNFVKTISAGKTRKSVLNEF